MTSWDHTICSDRAVRPRLLKEGEHLSKHYATATTPQTRKTKDFSHRPHLINLSDTLLLSFNFI